MARFEIIPKLLYQADADPWIFVDIMSSPLLHPVMLVDLYGIAPRPEVPFAEPSPIIYICWPIADAGLPDLQILDTIEQAAWQHMSRVSEGGTVISLCGAGLNRSGLLSALLVRRHSRMSGEEAIAHVRGRRPGSLSNPNFVAYLEKLDRPSF